jgi:hypothetical protein
MFLKKKRKYENLIPHLFFQVFFFSFQSLILCFKPQCSKKAYKLVIRFQKKNLTNVIYVSIPDIIRNKNTNKLSVRIIFLLERDSKPCLVEFEILELKRNVFFSLFSLYL